MEIMKQSITNYIYLIHEREFIRTSEDIYKVGMSRQPNLDRFNNYLLVCRHTLLCASQ